VAEGLGEVAQELATDRVDLLGEQPDVAGEGHRPFEHPTGPSRTSGPGQMCCLGCLVTPIGDLPPSGVWPGRRPEAIPDPWRCPMAEFTAPAEGILLAHFIVSNDVERSRRFYTEVLGGKVVFSGDVTYVALANSWIIINVGGGPTDDKPSVILETPPDPDRVSSFLNIRVRDIAAVYAEWSARGAEFLTPPKQHAYEIRCYIRDPDGHLIEVGQTTDPEGDWSAWS